MTLGAPAIAMTPELAAFREALVDRLGLSFDETRLPFLAELLHRRAAARAATHEQYLALVQRGDETEVQALAAELTVGETYFFRNAEQLRAFAQVVMPETLARRGSLRILSAGCASGDEPFTIAMLVKEHAAGAAAHVGIRAVDVNPVALTRAKAGRYSTWALRETPPELRRRWFVAAGREATLAPEVREAVSFELKNLSRDDDDLFAPSSYDVIFCRNVLMYFEPRAAKELVARIARALVPGGYLFLGHAETLRGLSQEFHLVHTHGAFYYRRKGEPLAVAPPLEPIAGWTPGPWMAAVARATERIRRLTDSTPPPPETSAAPPLDRGRVLELVDEERFAEAMSLLPEPGSERNDPAILLLRAVLLLHLGRFEGAREAAAAVLAADNLDAGAHYVLALCRESAGDTKGASEQDRIAAHLDPTFAMPRLHLGLLARRAGRNDDARREMEAAIELLNAEDPTRLTLFGGGFGRGGLIALCRAEIEKLGGTS